MKNYCYWILYCLCSISLNAQNPVIFTHPNGWSADEVHSGAGSIWVSFNGETISQFASDGTFISDVVNEPSMLHFNVNASNIFVDIGTSIKVFNFSGTQTGNRSSLNGPFDFLASGQIVQIGMLPSGNTGVGVWDAAGNTIVAEVIRPNASAIDVNSVSNLIGVYESSGNDTYIYDANLVFQCRRDMGGSAIGIAFDDTNTELITGRFVSIQTRQMSGVCPSPFLSLDLIVGVISAIDYGVGLTLVIVGGEARAYILNAPLPVELIKFKAIAKQDIHELSWVTSNEINLSHFLVEHSSNGQTWEDVDRVVGQGSNTIYEVRLSYTILPTHYYRLKIVDNDGSFAYSQVQVIENQSRERVVLYPNPTRGQVMLSHPAILYDTYGKAVLELSKGNSQIGYLTDGVYWVKYKNGEVRKLILKD